MGWLDRLKMKAGSQFIEIVEWLDDGSDALVYRFPVRDQEIKMGAQLIVRENQAALFVNEGKAADLFRPGRHTLMTRNIPILTTLRGWKHGFASPFKAEVYFFNGRIIPDLKWGTAQPVMMRDREFGMIRVRAFGTFATRIVDPKTFFETIVGTRGLTVTEEIAGQLRSIILARLSDAVAEAQVPALDLASRYDELAAEAISRIRPDFGSFGLELSRFYIENMSLPEDVQSAIDQRGRLGVMGDRLEEYAKLQAAEAMTLAAGSPGGAAGAGVGLGAGVAMGQALASAMPPAAPAEPRTPAAEARWTVSLGGRNFGPYTEQAVREMVASGQVPADAPAWKPGAAGWTPLTAYSEFRGLQGPPPPPPSPKA